VTGTSAGLDNIRAERSKSLYDRAARLVITALLELPPGKDRQCFVSRIVRRLAVE